jgi:tRNA 2-thiouridine synthesizing protein A
VSEDVVVDARGQRCPLPVIALARRARDLPPGTVVVVLATDPAARHDVPAWARMRGHETVSCEPEPGADVWRLCVRLGKPPAP